MSEYKQCYYTLMFENTGMFLNSNIMHDDTNKISEAIRFDKKDSAFKYLKSLRADIGIVVAKIKIEIERV